MTVIEPSSPTVYLSALPGNQNATPGGAAVPYTVTAQPLKDYTGTVTFDVGAPPLGISVSFGPATATIISNGASVTSTAMVTRC